MGNVRTFINKEIKVWFMFQNDYKYMDLVALNPWTDFWIVTFCDIRMMYVLPIYHMYPQLPGATYYEVQTLANY